MMKGHKNQICSFPASTCIDFQHYVQTSRLFNKKDAGSQPTTNRGLFLLGRIPSSQRRNPKMMDFAKATPFKHMPLCVWCFTLMKSWGPWLDLTIIFEKKRPHKRWFAQSSRGISCSPGPSIDDNNRILDRFFALSHRLEPPTTPPATGDACCLQPKMWCSNSFFHYHPRGNQSHHQLFFLGGGDQMG